MEAWCGWFFFINALQSQIVAKPVGIFWSHQIVCSCHDESIDGFFAELLLMLLLKTNMNWSSFLGQMGSKINGEGTMKTANLLCQKLCAEKNSHHKWFSKGCVCIVYHSCSVTDDVHGGPRWCLYDYEVLIKLAGDTRRSQHSPSCACTSSHHHHLQLQLRCQQVEPCYLYVIVTTFSLYFKALRVAKKLLILLKKCTSSLNCNSLIAVSP